MSELLLVSVFVVGLVMIAVTSARAIQSDTRQSNCETELRNLKMAVADFHSDRGSYPTSVAEVVAAGKVEADEVSRWSISDGGVDQPPVYRPDVARCG